MVPVRVRTWCRTGVGMRSSPVTPSPSRSSRTEDLVAELRALEQLGAVERIVFAEIPPRVEYQITGLGLTLQDALSPLAAWMSEYGDQLER